jgi:hypothetical protein
MRHRAGSNVASFRGTVFEKEHGLAVDSLQSRNEPAIKARQQLPIAPIVSRHGQAVCARED